MNAPPPEDHRATAGEARLDQALRQLPVLALADDRGAAALRAAQAALASTAPTAPAWLRWYERRLEPVLLSAACAAYLLWAVGAARPPAPRSAEAAAPAARPVAAPPTAPKWRAAPNQRADLARSTGPAAPRRS